MRGKSTKVAIEPPLSPASNEAPLSPMTLETAREVTHAMRQAGEAAPLFGDAFRAPANAPLLCVPVRFMGGPSTRWDSWFDRDDEGFWANGLMHGKVTAEARSSHNLFFHHE